MSNTSLIINMNDMIIEWPIDEENFSILNMPIEDDYDYDLNDSYVLLTVSSKDIVRALTLSEYFL